MAKFNKPLYVVTQHNNVVDPGFLLWSFVLSSIPDYGRACVSRAKIVVLMTKIQWNLGIKDTQGIVKMCPEF